MGRTMSPHRAATASGESGRWCRRVAPLTAGVLLVGLLGSPPASVAATPSEGTVSLEQRVVAWDGQHYAAGSAVFPGATCAVPVGSAVCDRFELTVDVDSVHWDANRGGVEISISWPDPSDDFDLHVFKQDSGERVGQSIGDNPSSAVPEERVFITGASGVYDVLVNPYSVTDSAYDGRAALHSFKKTGKPGGPGGEVPDEPLFDVGCERGLAGPFPCRNVDGRVPPALGDR